MRYTVSVSDAASSMLSEHLLFLAQANLSAAEKLRREIIDGIRSLEEMPERCPYLELGNHNYKYRKLLAAKRYLILYTIVEYQVYVEYIVDCRQDYQWLIGSTEL